MYGDILLFLPATNTNMRRLGIDFDIPISQAESIRKDIQCFLILRALYTRIIKLSLFSKDTTTTGNVAVVYFCDVITNLPLSLLPT